MVSLLQVFTIIFYFYGSSARFRIWPHLLVLVTIISYEEQSDRWYVYHLKKNLDNN